jgi:hypothetical protein
MMDMQNKVLKALSGKVEGFYLAGGTALSLFYFHHRESHDLDFFTKDFSRSKAEKIIKHLAHEFNLKGRLMGARGAADKAQILVYFVGPVNKPTLKIDFVEDVYEILKPPKIVDGIPVMSIEDIYIRKLFAACGTSGIIDETGKKRFIGGRQEVRDFFDLYFLSKTFMPLSVFVARYCDLPQIESIVVWYRTYNRMFIKLELNEIITDKSFAFTDMERHFRHEIEELVKKEI